MPLITTYIINLQSRTDRKYHIENEFAGRSEFKTQIVPAVQHPDGKIGLWQSIVKIVQMAKLSGEELILICEDDHAFTESYAPEMLIENLAEMRAKGLHLILGGIGWCNLAVPVSPDRFWIDEFWCTQFVIINSTFFDSILSESFAEGDTADGKFSKMTSHKMVIFPFISIQRDFGYSDVTPINNNIPISVLFEKASMALSKIHYIYRHYSS